jgi:hypothetical protein
LIVDLGKIHNVCKPNKRQFNGHEFDLSLTSCSKNVAHREAKKFRKRGFHTRVIESNTGEFVVYIRPKIDNQNLLCDI